MDTPDISLTRFRLSSILECVFSQQQMLNRQEQMPHCKREGLYEIKFIEFSRIGFLWEIKFVPPLLFHLAGTHGSGATAPLGPLCDQQWLVWDKYVASKHQLWPSKWWLALGGQKCLFSSLFRETSVTSIRHQPAPLLCRQSHRATGHWLPPTFLSGSFAGAWSINIFNILYSAFLFTHPHLLLSDFH